MNWHCYVVTGVYSNGDIQVYNPWGTDTSGTPRDGVADGYIRLTWAEFTRNFDSVVIA